MDKQAVLFEAILDFILSFTITFLAFSVTRAVPSVWLVAGIALFCTVFGLINDLAKRKEKVVIASCAVTTLLGTIVASATIFLLK